MKTRIKAGLVHFFISFLVIFAIFSFILKVCYPNPYFEVMKVGKLLLTLTTVDVFLGPVLTFVIFNTRKKRLNFEILSIVFLQTLALVYGFLTIFSARPVFLVFDKNSGYTMVSAYQIPENEIAKAQKKLSINGPELVGVEIPTTREERKKYIQEVFSAHVDLPRMLQYYVPYTSVESDVKRMIAPLDKLLTQSSVEKTAYAKTVLDEMRLKNHLRFEELGYIRMQVQDRTMSVVVRRSDASIVKFLPIEPPN